MVMTEELANFQPSYEGVVDPRFGSYTTSGLSIEVSPKEENFVTLKVENLKPPEKTSASRSAGKHQHDQNAPPPGQQ